MLLAVFLLFAGCAEKTPSVILLTKSEEISAPAEDTEPSDAGELGDCDYVLNTNSKKIHLPSCSSVGNIKTENIKRFSGDPEGLTDDGYSFCRVCLNGKYLSDENK